MPGYISRSLKVSHSSCTNIIELYLEIVDSIPKPLQGIWVHSKGTLGFRRWFHHYPSHFLLNPFFVSSRKVVESWNQTFSKKNSRACDTFGWLWLDSEVWRSEGQRWETNYKDSETQSASFAATWKCRAAHASESLLYLNWLCHLECTRFPFSLTNSTVGLQRSSVQPTRAFSESISNLNISFCT